MRNFTITVNGTAYSVSVEENAAGAPAAAPVAAPAAAPVAAPAAAPAAPKAAPAAGEKLNAPMPGTILEVKTTEGASVKKGDVLVILEAMKMENEILAPRDAVVKQVLVSKGAAVASGDALCVLA